MWNRELFANTMSPEAIVWNSFYSINENEFYAGGSIHISQGNTSVDLVVLYKFFGSFPNLHWNIITPVRLRCDGCIRSITNINGNLVVGGSFLTGLISINNIRPVGGGCYNPGIISSVTTIGEELLVCGSFISFDNTANNVGFVNPTTSKWRGLIESFTGAENETFNCSVASGSNIFLGGNFVHSTHAGRTIYSIGMFNTINSSWSPIGNDELAGVSMHDSGQIRQGIVNDLLLLENKLYVAGSFNFAGKIPCSNIAYYDLSLQKWFDLDGGVDQSANKLFYDNGKIFVGGSFSFVGKSKLESSAFAIWDLKTKSWLPSEYGVSCNDLDIPVVTCMIKRGNSLLIGGKFDVIGHKRSEVRNLALWQL